MWKLRTESQPPINLGISSISNGRTLIKPNSVAVEFVLEATVLVTHKRGMRGSLSELTEQTLIVLGTVSNGMPTRATAMPALTISMLALAFAMPAFATATPRLS